MDILIFDGKYYFNEDEWNLLVYGFNKFGKLVVDKGMKIVYYYYMGIGV